MGGRHSPDRFPERRCLPLSEWPAEDANKWRESLNAGDIIDGGGIRSKYRQISNRKTERGYGRFLTFLGRRGLLTTGPPADRITQPAVVEYVEEMKKFSNSSYTRLARLQELYDAAKVMDPRRDWHWIRQIASRIRSTAKPTRDKRSRMVSAMDLLTLGLELMDHADSATAPRLSAIMFRDGLIIALASLRQLRRRNLAFIVLDQHLVQRGTDWWLSFPGDEVKNAEPIDMPWPDDLVAALETWLKQWRPVLCACRNRWTREIGNALWVSSHGSPLTQQALYDRIVKQTKQAFGHSVNPHLVRDIAVTTLADVDPEHILIAAALLGHRDFRTTERYYLQSQMLQSTRRYQQGLLRLRHRRKG
jgi:integrase